MNYRLVKMSNNLFQHKSKVSRSEHNKQLGHSSFVIWLTGLSGSGKSTIASQLQSELYDLDVHSYVLDGDNIRLGINSDLDFSEEGRAENLRRIAEIAKLFTDAGTLTICSFISPLSKDREVVSQIIGEQDFKEIFIDCPLNKCEERDVKGLYKKARSGEIKNFTGIDSEYQIPKHPFLKLDTDKMSVSECVSAILENLEKEIN